MSGLQATRLFGLSGFTAANSAHYASAAGVAEGSASGFSALVAICPTKTKSSGNAELIFGNTDGTNGWYISREVDTTTGASPLLLVYKVYLLTGGSLGVVSLAPSGVGRPLLIGFTFNGSNDFTLYANGGAQVVDTTNTFVANSGGTLRLGSNNGANSIDAARDIIMGAMFDSAALSMDDMINAFAYYRATGSFRGAQDAGSFTWDCVYDFIGTAPSATAPATLTNYGSLGTAADLDYQGTAALTPQVVDNVFGEVATAS